MPAPVDILPSEVLSHIFSTLVQSWLYAYTIGDKSYGPINYPLLLSSVCVRWRQVAITTPSLWSYLDFDIAGYPSINLQYVKFCYERSASAPLSVRFGRYDHECSLESIDDQLASLLGSYAARLESLAISYWRPKFVKEILAILFAQGTATRVRKLALHATSGEKRMVADSSLPQKALYNLLEPLHTLYLEGVTFDWALIPCRNLVELQLVELAPNAVPSPSQLVHFLNANPAIRRLKIAGFDLAFYEHNLPPIQLPELRNLELDVSPEFMSWFFAQLVPGPHELDLQLKSYVSSTHRTQVVDTLRNFFRQARIVSLRIWGSLWLPFSSIVAHLPHLETLGISNPGYPTYDFTEINSQTELLPKLHTVELIRCSTRDVVTGIRIILSLPSVRRVLFSTFYLVNEVERTLMDEEHIKEWMSWMGVAAPVSESSSLWHFYHPSPFA
ncbi:hypothetical protein BDV93DRAFT_521039 [Ceratobasidium sp. AG-I]|nr:hypothetical protein BDV93DRAFT_521039 [Ceratobasidium sp. AG-I]